MRRVKIALTHLRHAKSGGTERYLNQLAVFLAERDWEVEIVCRRHGEPPHPRVRFRRLHGFALGHSWRVLSFARSVERLHRSGEFDVVFGLGRTWSQDVVRLGGGLTTTFLESMRAEGDRTPVVAKGRQRVNLEIERRNFDPPRAQRVIANSHMVARDLAARYDVDPENVDVVHNGVNLERFDATRYTSAREEIRRAAGIEGEAPTLLFLGTGYVRKGLPKALEAFALARRERKELRMLVAGFDSSGVDWTARARELSCADAVHFAGGTDRPEHYFAAADAYVLPTRYDPFANSTLEALASGLPTLTTPTNGGCEVVTPGVDGEVLGVDAPAADWAAALLHHLDPAHLPESRAAARATAERNGIGARLADTERILLEVARRRGASN
jgi:UDP-glucose:(heptosyl)LPS alpha-1,3-glucosyltransferase